MYNQIALLENQESSRNPKRRSTLLPGLLEITLNWLRNFKQTKSLLLHNLQCSKNTSCAFYSMI